MCIGKKRRIYLLLICTVFLFISCPVQAQLSEAKTPSDVFSVLELLDRKLTIVMENRKISQDKIVSFELRDSDLKPMHVYQLHLACIEQLREFQRSVKISEIPLVVAAPRSFKPIDVLHVSEMLLQAVDRTGKILQIDSLPMDRGSFSGKTPTDVFEELLPVLAKLFALNGKSRISPSEVYAQSIRARFDAQEIISVVAMSEKHSERRRELQASAFGMNIDGNHLVIDEATNKTPADALRNCQSIRRTLDQVFRQIDSAQTNLNQHQSKKVRPADVFIQTQLIIAELNILKKLTATTAITRPTMPAENMTPRDVCGQLIWTSYILEALLKHHQVPKQFAH